MGMGRLMTRHSHRRDRVHRVMLLSEPLCIGQRRTVHHMDRHQIRDLRNRQARELLPRQRGVVARLIQRFRALACALFGGIA
jgi:hypothetical protein